MPANLLPLEHLTDADFAFLAAAVSPRSDARDRIARLLRDGGLQPAASETEPQELGDSRSALGNEIGARDPAVDDAVLHVLGDVRRADEQHLDYPLLSDPDMTVHRAYGVWGEKNSYGKTIVGVLRSTFVVGAEGELEFAQYNVRATGHVQALRKKLELA